jgi:hypothetical protein
MTPFEQKFFCVRYNGSGPTKLIRDWTVPLGVEVAAAAAAKRLGWDGSQPMAYFDSDDLILGGVNWSPPKV